MMRATAWTGGLFALGSVVCHLFRAPWVEPMVLLGLGITLLLVSGRGASAAKPAAAHADDATPAAPALEPASGDRAAR
ncbi:MAG TPA: hypothetical protein VFE30_18465 [Anaeromyxobacteraceae bacterium]|jgi:hypothetical protein|nr:hypothetical protein [Anaeromyxobacteraceae bacterium]